MFRLLAITLFALTIAAARPAAADDAKPAAKAKVYELRTYTTHPGKLEALHARFRDHTMKIFARHGMTNVMYWTPEGSKDTLVYLLAHESREAADASWAAFRKDPEWQKAYAASKVDGPLVKKVERKYLVPTVFSPGK